MMATHEKNINLPKNPMEPIACRKVPKDRRYIHEIKWDGIRMLAYINNGTVQLYTKEGFERIQVYPELKDLPKYFEADTLLLDGELVVLNEKNKCSFQGILQRERGGRYFSEYYGKKEPVHYMVFDCLYYNGKDLTQEPLMERKEVLKEIFEPNAICGLSDAYENGQQLYERMKKMSYEGVVSKIRDSAYHSGTEHHDWFKVKIARKMLAVVAGLKLKNNVPVSMALGIYRGDKLFYIGNVALSLRKNELLLIYNNRKRLKTEECPLVDFNSKEEFLWLQPRLTCWVHFTEWTNEGHLAHPRMKGFTDFEPEEATGDEIVEQ